MKIFSLALVLLICLPAMAQEKAPPSKVKGVSLPASIPVGSFDYQKRIVPQFDDASKVIEVKWNVIPSGKSIPTTKPDGNGLIITVPAPEDAYLVQCYVLYGGDKPWMTEIASTVIEWPGSPTTGQPTTQPPPQPTQPQPTQPTQPPTQSPPGQPGDMLPMPQPMGTTAPAAVNRLHVMLITDGLPRSTELDQIMSTGLSQLGVGNVWYQFDVRLASDVGLLKTSNLLGKIADAQGKLLTKLPAVILLNGNTKPAKMIGAPIPVTLTANQAANAQAIAAVISQTKK